LKVEKRQNATWRAAVVVAHPDDETLWVGGTMLLHPEWSWEVVTLCRASDPDRAPRFARALERLGASGRLGDLDDGPDQAPLDASIVEKTVLSLLSATCYNFIVTHGDRGEYTRHRRHEETARAVMSLWRSGRLRADALWQFAYDDAEGAQLPRAVEHADRCTALEDNVWAAKYAVITEVYGFAPDSFEARTTPHAEAFWCFKMPANSGGVS